METIFTKRDIEQMQSLGISVSQAEKQLQYFKTGLKYPEALAPASLAKGILSLDPEQQEACIALYDNWKGNRMKFVPASGAATRMFKDLIAAKAALEDNPGAVLTPAVQSFFDRLPDFAFYPRLVRQKNFDAAKPLRILQLLLNREAMAYEFLPKGLLPFHLYPARSRTPFEEHVAEAALYATGPDRVARLHFTVSAEHREHFEILWKQVGPYYESYFHQKFALDFSEQRSCTATLAATRENEPFRDEQGNLIFRPGGHGALLENLKLLSCDMVFIKNIDNVVPETKVSPTVRWKKVLAGVLLRVRKQIHAHIKELESGASDLQCKAIARYLRETFCMEHPPMRAEDYRSYLFSKLNRPLRVCGMVRNTGEPGGGPFIVRNADGSTSLQILESAQFDLSDPSRARVFEASTHFNPVDMVCSFMDYKGKPYPLQEYADPDAGFISSKTYRGRVLKAYELPGLWNGAMSDWNTIFVEVPLETFNPVKTINDLLKPEHFL